MNYCAQPRFTSARGSLTVSDRPPLRQTPLDKETTPAESVDSAGGDSEAVDVIRLPSTIPVIESDMIRTEPGSPVTADLELAEPLSGGLVEPFGPPVPDTARYTYRRVGHLLADKAGEFAGAMAPVMRGSLWGRLFFWLAANYLEPYLHRLVDFVCDRLESGDGDAMAPEPLAVEEPVNTSLTIRKGIYAPGSRWMLPSDSSTVALTPYVGSTGYATVF